MIVKCGRNKFDLTSDDLIMYNGSCYQIITRAVRSGWHEYPPVLSNSKSVKLIKEGKIYLSHSVIRMGMTIDYYKISQ